MSEQRFSLQMFQDALAQGLGQEGAQAVLKQALIEALIFQQGPELSQQEAALLCEKLKTREGFIRTIARVLMVRINLAR